jgi:glycosyltransferase involved in cell wall biosynthesis
MESKIRILWLSVTPSGYGQNTVTHNGGGWIESLEKLVSKSPEIELAVTFLYQKEAPKCKFNKITYYPIGLYTNRWKKIAQKYLYWREDRLELDAVRKVIHDYKPDVIHVFGTEWSFGLAQDITNIPVVIHIQGLAAPYLNAYFPPGINKYQFFLSKGFSPKQIISQTITYARFVHRAQRERRIMKICNYYMGRTAWDRAISSFISPESSYYHCDEVLRPVFSESAGIWKSNRLEKKTIVTTISSPLYKGGDLLLKTAKLLTENFPFKFEWKVFGVRDLAFAEKTTGIQAIDVNIQYCGVCSADHLKAELVSSDLYVHTSYIENSPNSICEAQLLGVPTVATNVGGTSSLIEHNVSGFLVPANDPYMMAATISGCLSSPESMTRISASSVAIAKQRHDESTILSSLIEIYKSILKRSAQ